MTEEYCWAITEAAERAHLGRSRYNVLEFGFQLDFLLHTYNVDHMYMQFRCGQNLIYAGTKLLRASGSVCKAMNDEVISQ